MNEQAVEKEHPEKSQGISKETLPKNWKVTVSVEGKDEWSYGVEKEIPMGSRPDKEKRKLIFNLLVLALREEYHPNGSVDDIQRILDGPGTVGIYNDISVPSIPRKKSPPIHEAYGCTSVSDLIAKLDMPLPEATLGKLTSVNERDAAEINKAIQKEKQFAEEFEEWFTEQIRRQRSREAVPSDAFKNRRLTSRNIMDVFAVSSPVIFEFAHSMIQEENEEISRIDCCRQFIKMGYHVFYKGRTLFSYQLNKNR